ncbi:hypothetical protein GJ744_002660 [Endocarpon pusillum]|uniref:Uncharacterized protein n=1 Tax=Endocarpon pusillum TaxID=364733 RepID=A0A8H7ABJ8_9EURO|nr:hypothetical protein GJ744_002660 [Endocarpon pusillum]
MPVDDLLEWAAETSRHGSGRPSTYTSNTPADEPPSYTEYRSMVNRPPSPAPRKSRLARWQDAGHCAAACSGRCSVHAAEQEQQEALNAGDTSLRGVAEALQTQHRRHHRNGRPKLQRNDSSQNSRLSSSPTPKTSAGKQRNSRLDLAREALLNGNVTVARAIVAQELERLGIAEDK